MCFNFENYYKSEAGAPPQTLFRGHGMGLREGNPAGERGLIDLQGKREYNK